jgi:hypothetical protein
MINFLIVGAPKAGTTSVFEYLNQHPKVFSPQIKEPHYFACDQVKARIEGVINTHEDYNALFENKSNDQITGEASVFYLYYHQDVIRKIKKEVEMATDIKIIICTRNPIDRAYSAYLQAKRYNKDEVLSFADALDAEKTRVASSTLSPMLFYKGCSQYSEAIQNYQRNFKNVFIINDKELKFDPQNLINKLYHFLELSPLKDIEVVIKNRGGNDWNSEYIGFLIKNIIAPEKFRRALKKHLSPVHSLTKKLTKAILMRKSKAMDTTTKIRLEKEFEGELAFLNKLTKTQK